MSPSSTAEIPGQEAQRELAAFGLILERLARRLRIPENLAVEVVVPVRLIVGESRRASPEAPVNAAVGSS